MFCREVAIALLVRYAFMDPATLAKLDDETLLWAWRVVEAGLRRDS